MAKRVLIVDDDEALAKAIRLRCLAMGCEAECSPDGLHAIMAMRRHRPDLVILDIHMPVDGLHLGQRLARDDQLRDVPLVFLTGRSDRNTIAQCRALGAAHVVKGTDIWSALRPIIMQRLTSRPDDVRREVQTGGAHNE